MPAINGRELHEQLLNDPTVKSLNDQLVSAYQNAIIVGATKKPDGRYELIYDLETLNNIKHFKEEISDYIESNYSALGDWLTIN